MSATKTKFEPEDYWRGWDDAYDDRGWDDNETADWRRGYSEARMRQADDERELAP